MKYGDGFALTIEILDLTDPDMICDDWAECSEGSEDSVGGILDNTLLLTCDVSYNSCFAITPTENFKANSTYYNGTMGSSVVIFNETLNQDALFITGGASKVSHFNHYSKHS